MHSKVFFFTVFTNIWAKLEVTKLHEQEAELHARTFNDISWFGQAFPQKYQISSSELDDF